MNNRKQKVIKLEGTRARLYNYLIKDISIIQGISTFVYTILILAIISLLFIGLKTQLISSYFEISISASCILMLVYFVDRWLSRSNGLYQLASLIYAFYWLINLYFELDINPPLNLISALFIVPLALKFVLIITKTKIESGRKKNE